MYLGAFIPVINLFSNLLISRGHSSIYMWSTISLSLLQIVAVCAIYPYGLEWMLRIFVIINIGWLFVWFRFVKRGDRIKTARYAERHLSLSLPIHCTRSVNSLCYSAHRNLYLNMAAKIIMVAGLYALVLWKLQSTIFRESIEFLLKKKEHEPHSLHHIRLQGCPHTWHAWLPHWMTGQTSTCTSTSMPIYTLLKKPWETRSLSCPATG